MSFRLVIKKDSFSCVSGTPQRIRLFHRATDGKHDLHRTYIAVSMTHSHAQQLRIEAATDLHTHTTCSDGSLTPSELVRKACEYQISVLAICDHDTTDAVHAAQEASADTPLEVLPGCELTCAESGREYHLLAYCMDTEEPAFQEYLSATRQMRVDRCEHMLRRLQACGPDITMDDVLMHAGGASIVRPHIAAALVTKGYVQTTQEAFDRYLHNRGEVYVPIPDRPLDTAVAMIHDAGGIAVIAHPARNITTQRVVELIGAGLDGIEAIYPRHNKRMTSYYHSLARSYRILSTGGSDFHGSRPYDDVNLGAFSVELGTVEAMKEASLRYRYA